MSMSRNHWLYRSFIAYKNAMDKNDSLTAEAEIKMLKDENYHHLAELLVNGSYEEAVDWIGENT